MPASLDITGKKIVLITGTSIGGIGFDTAAALADSPDYHIILSGRNPAKNEASYKKLQSRNLPGSFSTLDLDITSQDSISAAAKRVEEEFGRLDVLINNAGITSTDKDLITRYRTVMDTNAIGVAATTYAFEHLLKKSSEPRLLFISSGLGSINQHADPEVWHHKVEFLDYRMSKAAMDMLGMHCHLTFKEWGCKVWVVCPGFVITNLTGEDDRENRKNNGAMTAEESAAFLKNVVIGKRDTDVGKFVHVEGVNPW